MKLAKSLAAASVAVALLSSAAQAKDRVVFRGAKTAKKDERKRIDFGLTEAQKKAIFDLSGGSVDFRELYFEDSDSPARTRELMQREGFDTVIKSGVLPPLAFTPDPELSGQWWIERLKAPSAWGQSLSGAGVTLADCDAGYHHDEPDLKPNMLLEHAYDLADKDAPFVVNDGYWAFHGTAVAAIIAGVHDESGTNGIAYGAKLVPLQNFNYDGAVDDLDKEEATARCVLRAITIQGVNVVVLENQTSGGSSETFAGTREAVKLAQLAGITIVSAAGNYSTELTAERDEDTGSIIVGALGEDGKKADFSNFGERITIAAFGENLHTLLGPNGEMGDFGGTSGATPQVAAAVALMLEANPALTPAQVRTALETSRVVTRGENDTVGGLLDIEAAVSAARALGRDDEKLSAQRAVLAKLHEILGTH